MMTDEDGELWQSIHSLDLSGACSAFIDDVSLIGPETTKELSIIEQWASTSSPSATQFHLVNALSHVILIPRFTETVAIHFKPLLIGILDRSLQRLEEKNLGWEDEETTSFFHCLGRLLPPFPNLLPIARYFLTQAHIGSLPMLKDDSILDSLLLSTFRLLYSSETIFLNTRETLSSMVFLKIVKGSKRYSVPTRLLALRILSLMEGISDATLEDLQAKYIGRLELKSVQNLTPATSSGSFDIQHEGVVVEELNAWILPLQESERVQTIRIGKATICNLEFSQHIDTSIFGPRVICLGGTLFFTVNSEHLITLSQFRETENVRASLSSLSRKLSSCLPVLLSGPEACGKSSIIKYACNMLYPASSSHIIILQLGDQSGIDAKSLIGTYISSTKNPGSFEWCEGALTRALRLGKWVILKDVDKASREILSVIKALVEDMGKDKQIGAKPSLDLGPRGRVYAHHSFALFATRTISMPKEQLFIPNATFYSHEHWDEVQLKPFSESDILEIIKCKCPLLSLAEDGTLKILIKTYARFSDVAIGSKGSKFQKSQASKSGTIRIPSLHDLLKWCNRIEASLQRLGPSAPLLARTPFSNQAIHEEIVLEACDIFLGSTPIFEVSAPLASADSSNTPSSVFHLLAQCLNIDVMEAWHAFLERKPECRVEMSEDTGIKIIRIGRTTLKRSEEASQMIQLPSRHFAMTGPAARLMEKIAVCISSNEATLIVGETGTGKTSVIQYLASLARKPLIALNLSQQMETSDLVGGFKPLDAKMPAMDLHNEWIDLFQATFSSRRNARYLQAERKVLVASKWLRLYETWKESIKLAIGKLQRNEIENGSVDEDDLEPRFTKARRITENGNRQDQVSNVGKEEENALLKKWFSFEDKIESFAVQFTGKKKNLVFSFIEGPLIKAIRSGSWVLLDEINLATTETLDCLTALLQSSESSIVLTERGDLEPVPRHAEFRLFACMNPATDVGKKDLPSNLRSRFTEFYAPSPDLDREALIVIVEKYIGQEAVGDRGIIMDVAECYSCIRQLSQLHQIADGANQRPHYSIRTLSRALVFAKDICATYGLRRAVWEGFTMTFTMLLDERSCAMVKTLLNSEIMAKAKNAKSAASFVPPYPSVSDSSTFVQLGPFWLESGPLPLDSAPDYVLTPSVQDKLIGLARAVLTRRSPVLIQGPTSAGKTSAIEYLARRTGHKFVRINNHEHTDIQEYIGSYSSDPDSGQLVFQEGLLVTALRQGHWIVLDELNLAPSDVLEALNRLLDDNRELYISEIGQTITPHPHFMLFATQNPPRQYAGRKELSRAFRNRFLEIHFADVPQDELQTILTNRCHIAPSYAEKVVKVFRELQKRRQTGRVFDTTQAFVTLRDLFRWGYREARDYQQLAENGYMLLAERARRSEDALVVKEIIEEIMNVKICTNSLYNIFNDSILADRVGPEIAVSLHAAIKGTSIVWTSSMQRLACLIGASLRYNEPVLLIGETGSGKTSICEVLANTFKRDLTTVNCHQNTDTADLLGGQRPLRNRRILQEIARSNGLQALAELDSPIESSSDLSLVATALANIRSSNVAQKNRIKLVLQQVNHSLSLFEWNDGPLVQAMKRGQHFLLDEISLADDSVLERLNSVLEPDRTLILAERSSANGSQALEIEADSSFQVIATMNPGGDYGKKELSPALRNRFTEIWVPSVHAREDLVFIINSLWLDTFREMMQGVAEKMVDFLNYYVNLIGSKDFSSVGLRDLIAWAHFINEMVLHKVMAISEGFVHGAFMTLIDGVPLHSAIASKSRQEIQAIVSDLSNKVYNLAEIDESSRDELNDVKVLRSAGAFRIGKFMIEMGTQETLSTLKFSLIAPTPSSNALRVMRAMQLRNRAILLEGSPGAGKTSLIVALAKECNYKLTRINLSDQTDLADLFGADLPVEGGKAGEFDWKDAAFLRAMQEGNWVLLDEMNLASQTVLEGLNSCLDHRGTVYIPELGRTFTKHVNFRIFAAQNPQYQGGGRKGLPKSFLNRFTKVHIEELHEEDFHQIAASVYDHIDKDEMQKMIRFNSRLQTLLSESSLFSKAGQPWEFNLRDLLRWFDMMHSRLGLNIKTKNPMDYLGSLYLLRFRSHTDRVKVAKLYSSVFGVEPIVDVRPWFMLTSRYIQVGHVLLPRRSIQPMSQRKVPLKISKNQFAALQALGECIKLSWPAMLVGDGKSGKTTLIRQLARMTNCELEEVRLNSGTDAVDIIGGFQQEDDGKIELEAHLDNLIRITQDVQVISASHVNSVDCDDHSWDLLAILRDQKEQLDMSTDSLDIMKIIKAIQTFLQLDNIPSQCRMGYETIIGRLLHYQEQQSQTSQGSRSKFAWIDGPVLRAMRKGTWLLLDEANLCSSSVLDRLNSLLEPDGKLVLSERGVMSATGQIEVVTPHKDFRIFFAINSRFGELSRAMRNRGLEIYLDHYEINDSIDCLDATLFNLTQWTRSILEVGDESSIHKSSMQLALLGQGIPLASMPLVPLLISPDHLAHLSLILHEEIISSSGEIKSLIEKSNQVENHFLQEMSLDLQLNPTTHDYNQRQRLIFDRLQLIVKISILNSHLQHCANHIPGKEQSILQKSALYNQGQDVEGLSRQDRKIFLFLCNIVEKIQDCLLASHCHVLEGAIEGLYTLFDCSGYLIEKWAKDVLNDYSSSKVILGKAEATIRCWSMELPLEPAQIMVESLDMINDQIQLKSGLAMQAIWRDFLPSIIEAEAISSAVELSQQLELIQRRSTNVQELYSNVIDVAVELWQFGFEKETHRSELFDIARRAGAALKAQIRLNQNYDHMDTDSDVILLSILYLASQNGYCQGGIKVQQVKFLCNFIKSSFTFPATTAISLQRHNTSTSHGLQSFTQLNLDWIKEIFKSSSQSGKSSSNTEDLVRPVLFQSVLSRCCSDQRVSLEKFENNRNNAERLAQIISSTLMAKQSSRKEIICELMLDNLESLSICLLHSLQERSSEVEDASLSGKISQVHYSLQSVEEFLTCTNLPESLRNIATNLKLSLELSSLLRIDHKVTVDTHQIGSAALQFGLILIDSYLPNVAIDPLVTLGAQAEFTRYRIHRLEQEKEAILLMEKRITGNGQSMLTRQIDSTLKELHYTLNQHGEINIRSSNTSLLHKLIQEMISFSQQVLSNQKMDQVLDSLGKDSARGKLLTLQMTLCAQLDRLSSVYSSLWDLVQPLQYTLSTMLLGIGLLLRFSTMNNQSATSKHNEKILNSIVVFPTSLSTMQYIPEEIPIRVKPNSAYGELAVPLLLLKVRAVLTDFRNGSKNVLVLREIYDQLWYLWTLDEEHQKQQREEETDLYKVRNLNLNVEEEERREKEEFLALFPTCVDVMEEEADPDKISGRKQSQNRSKKAFFHSEDLLQLFKLHSALFDKGEVRREDTFDISRVQIARSMMEASYNDFSEDLDKKSAGLQMSIMDDYLNSKGDCSDFYLGRNEVEAFKMIRLVQSVIRKLDQLIEDWPDQEVLRHIKQRCEKILSLDSASPVHQILAALEGLLQHTEDWEIFANSKNTLQSQRDQMISLIIEWRRLELSNWKVLMSKETIKCRDNVHSMWFTLFQVISKTDYEDKDKLAELVSLLDQFMRGSSIGQYKSRIDLIESFALYLRMLRGESAGHEASKIESTLFNTGRFFKLFQEAVQIKLENKRVIIEKEIADFVKLASWKDTNIHALKVSASKTHRKLHRCLRRYRDILNEPVDPILASLLEVRMTEKDIKLVNDNHLQVSVDWTQLPISIDNDAPQFWHTGKDTPLHLIRISRTLQALYSFYQKDVSPLLLNDKVSSLVFNLQSEIVSQSENLAKQTPSIWKEENEKLIKHLETRKRKAWSDLLKELRRIGLTVSSIDGLSASELIHGVQVFSLTPINLSSQTTFMVLKLQESDRMHYQLLSLLPILRATISSTSRSEDIQVNQLQRGLSFVENCFLASFVERRKLTNLQRDLEWIDTSSKRLLHLADDQNSTLSSIDVQRLPTCLDLWKRLLSALDEIIDKAEGHSALSLFNEGGLDLKKSLDQMLLCKQNVKEYVLSLDIISKSIKSSGCTLVTRKEKEQIDSNSEVFRGTIEILQSASDSTPALCSMCIPTLEWLHQAKSTFILDEKVGRVVQEDHANGQGESIGVQSDRIISSIVLIAQELRNLATSYEGQEDSEFLSDREFTMQRQRLTKIRSLLRLDMITQEVYDLFSHLNKSTSSDLAPIAISRLAPFFQVYRSLVEDHFTSCLEWYYSLVKVDLTLCKLMTSLATRGFCKPRQEEEQEGEAGIEDHEQLESGMGLGEGQGAQDVTDTLQDDEMMEELQSEVKEKKDNQHDDKETKGEKNAREMEQDFDGELGDVEKEQQEDEQSGDKEEDDIDQEEAEMDDAVGKVDPLDIDAVDEKTWGEKDDNIQEDGDRDRSEKEKQGKQSENKEKKEGKEAPEGIEEDQEGAEAAGQRGEEDNFNGKEKEGEKSEEIKEGDEDISEEKEEEMSTEDDEIEDGANQEEEAAVESGLGRAIDDEARQENNLDLNLDDDLRMDDAKSNDGSDDDDMNGLSDISSEHDLGDRVEDEDASSINDFPEQSKAEEKLDSPEEDDIDTNDDVNVPHEVGEEAMQDKEEKEVQSQGKHEQQSMAAESGLIDDTPMDNENMSGDASENNPANQTQLMISKGGHQGSAQSEATAAVEERESPLKDQDEVEKLRNDFNKVQSGGEKEDQGERSNDTGNEEKEEAQAGKKGSLGDVLEDFKRNFDSIEERLGQEARKEGQRMPEDLNNSDVEHIFEDEDAEMQALGAAQEEEMLHGMQDVDLGIEESLDTQEDDHARFDEEIKQIEARESWQPDQNLNHEEEKVEDGQGGLIMNDVKSNADVELKDGKQDNDDMSDIIQEDQDSLNLQNIEKSIQDDMEALFAATNDEQRHELAQNLWKSYLIATNDYAFTLSEQLRLILAPTKATKLIGDFKSGKRLNMRKIIPFIASDYVKDKIWLRRNLPQKREYQVLLCIDDSKSMFESKNMTLAYKSLALVCGALDKLEVGQIGVMKFGKQSELLKSFDGDVIRENQGGNVLERLQFQQKNTDVSTMLQESYQVLLEAREKQSGTSTTKLWQLQIIISDGICQDHYRLSALLRRASEEQILIVFVILDSLQQNSSILTMNSVQYITGATGRSQIQMTRYLDTFPFEYFVIVREVADLPEVLSTTLRQWAQKISAS